MPHQTANADAITDGRGRAMLSVDDIAKDYLGCSSRHVRRLSDAGKMPAPIKLGSLVRWRRHEIDEWIANGCPVIRSPRRPTTR